MTFRTTFRDTRSSRQIALIDLPCPKNARRIFAIVSTISIPTSAPRIMEASVDPQPPGSRLDADHPENGVLIPRRNTIECFYPHPSHQRLHVTPADLVSLGSQQAAQHPRAGEGELQMHPVEPSHELQVA